jgi:hypothetical protein
MRSEVCALASVVVNLAAAWSFVLAQYLFVAKLRLLWVSIAW